jgi:hypothetical protein
MPFSVWQPGMRVTASRANDAAMIGAVVFFANRGNPQSVPSGVDSASGAMQWDEVQVDSLGGWNAAQPTRWTVPRSGVWEFAGAVAFDASGNGTLREAVWYLNGAAMAMGRARFAATQFPVQALTVEARTVPRLLSAGDYVELVAAQNSGGTLGIATGSYRPYISITYCGPA